MALDLRRGNHWPIRLCVRVLVPLCLIGERAAVIAFAPESVVACGSNLFLAEARDASRPRRSEDGQVIAGLNAIFPSKVYVNDLASRHHLLKIARQHNATLRLAVGVAEAFKRNFCALKRRDALLYSYEHIT